MLWWMQVAALSQGPVEGLLRVNLYLHGLATVFKVDGRLETNCCNDWLVASLLSCKRAVTVVTI